MAIISGSIADSRTGAPIENATIIIGTSFALSDENGNFSMEAPTGRQKLIVIQRYYKKIKELTDISGNSTITIRMERE